MGFEITYKFCKRDSEGNYNKEERDSRTVRVGDAYDEVPLGQVVSKIVSLYAKRNIFVFDLDVFEFTKKQISFREAEDGEGIVIKNKKFKFDDQIDSNFVEVDAEVQEEVKKVDKELKLTPAPAKESGKNQVLRYEYYSPEKELIQHYKDETWKFVVNKKYPILEEKVKNQIFYYTVIDENGKKVFVPSLFFLPTLNVIDTNLVNQDTSNMPNLRYDNVENVPMVDLRRR